MSETPSLKSCRITSLADQHILPDQSAFSTIDGKVQYIRPSLKQKGLLDTHINDQGSTSNSYLDSSTGRSNVDAPQDNVTSMPSIVSTDQISPVNKPAPAIRLGVRPETPHPKSKMDPKASSSPGSDIAKQTASPTMETEGPIFASPTSSGPYQNMKTFPLSDVIVKILANDPKNISSEIKSNKELISTKTLKTPPKSSETVKDLEKQGKLDILRGLSKIVKK